MKKSKIYYKILSALMALSLVCAPAVSAEVALDASVTQTDVTLTVQCGEEYKGKDIVVQVIGPTGDLDDLKLESGNYGVTDSDAVRDTFSCIYHGVADENGNLEFTFKPTGDKGKYTVRINGAGMYTPFETSFEFVTDDDAEYVVETLAANPSVDAVAALFVKPENENVYKPYQILGLDNEENAVYEFYKLYDNADEAVKTKVHEYIYENIKDDSTIQTAAFLEIYEDAVLIECLNAASASELAAYIETYADALNLSAQKEYTGIYKKSDIFDATAKEEFLKAVANADLSGKSVESAAEEICQILLLSTLSHTKATGVLDTVINNFEEELLAAGAKIDEYKDIEKPLEACRDVIDAQPFDSLADFAAELNKVLPEDDDDSSGGSGGGGNRVSKGNGGISYAFSDVAPVIPEVPDASSYVFNDISTVVWAHEAITMLHEKGIISGRPDGSFGPDTAVTREEFVKMLVLALGFDTNAEKAEFADVSGDEWFAPYVYTAFNNDVVSGMGDGFGVGINISRQDMAVMCANALSAKGIELDAVKSGMTFTDSISDYAKDAVEKLWSAGLVNGLSDTEFGAKGTTTRAQAAKLLYEVTKAIS